jgi:dTDP-4-dehydrorhamnose 3,5-epimerase
MEQFLGQDHYALVQIPPGVWNGFKGMSDPFALVANCCTHTHDPLANRTERLDPFDNDIPYDWRICCH